MKDYCTDQFLLVEYPNGAGGKFLITSLMLFDQIAHWSIDVQQGNIDYQTWYSNIWPHDISRWVTLEPNQPWNLDFYSRRWFRNNHISCHEFNQLVDVTANSYFHDMWNRGLIITDHWHKKTLPDFFQSAQTVEILLPPSSLELYKNLVKNKLFLWHDGKVISTMDHPEYAWDEKTRNNSLAYKNDYEMSMFKDYDEFFYTWLIKQHWVQPFMTVVPDLKCIASIALEDLINVDGYINLMDRLSIHFSTSLDRDSLAGMHRLWKQRSNIT